MYNRELLKKLIDYITKLNGINDKIKLASLVQRTFNLTRDKSVFYCDDFAIRFCKSKSNSFSNTVD